MSFTDKDSTATIIERLRRALHDATEKVSQLQSANTHLEQELEAKIQNEKILNERLNDAMEELSIARRRNNNQNNNNSNTNHHHHHGAIINLDDDDEDFRDLVIGENNKNKNSSKKQQRPDDLDSLDAAMNVKNNNHSNHNEDDAPAEVVREKRGGSRTPSYHPSRADSVDLELDVDGNNKNESNNNNNQEEQGKEDEEEHASPVQLSSSLSTKKTSKNPNDPPLIIVGGNGTVLLDDQHDGLRRNNNNNKNNNDNSTHHRHHQMVGVISTASGDQTPSSSNLLGHSISSNAATVNSETPSLGMYYNNPQLAYFIEEQATAGEENLSLDHHDFIDDMIPASSWNNNNPSKLSSSARSKNAQQQKQPQHLNDEEDDGDDHDPRTKTYDETISSSANVKISSSSAKQHQGHNNHQQHLDDDEDGDDHDPRTKAYDASDSTNTIDNNINNLHSGSSKLNSLLTDSSFVATIGRDRERTLNMEEFEAELKRANINKNNNNNDFSTHHHPYHIIISPDKTHDLIEQGVAQLQQHQESFSRKHQLLFASQRTLSEGSAASSHSNQIFSQQYSPSILSTDVSALSSPLHQRQLPSALTLNAFAVDAVDSHHNDPTIPDHSQQQQEGGSKPNVVLIKANQHLQTNEPFTLMLENSSVASFAIDPSRQRFGGVGDGSLAGLESKQQSLVYDENGNIIISSIVSQQQHNRQTTPVLTVVATSSGTIDNQQQTTPLLPTAATVAAVIDSESKDAAAAASKSGGEKAEKAEKKSKDKVVVIQYPENTKHIKTQTTVCRMQSVACTASYSDILKTMSSFGGTSSKSEEGYSGSTSEETNAKMTMLVRQLQHEDEQPSDADDDQGQTGGKVYCLESAKLAQEHLDRLQRLLDHANSVVVKSAELSSLSSTKALDAVIKD